MRSIFRAAPVAVAFMFISASTASAQSQRFAYITSSVLLDQAPGRAEVEAVLQKEGVGAQEQVKRMSDSLDAMAAAFEKKQATLSATQRETQGKELQARQLSYQQRAAELQQKAQARQGELIQPILDRIKQAIEDVRVEGGYSFVFNADQGSPIVAVDKNLNVTDKVLAKLRATPAAPVAAKPVAPAPAPAGVTRPTTPQL